ncbi:MAG: dienelactone hydrolase family protein [Proteobacteria bacterium]|nr:dienelactone hydrolase family protein [Pseudomonadota bacterium]MBI3499792.1 dienelactone hydrolase family protein [Pseudomonadota bacterium]
MTPLRSAHIAVLVAFGWLIAAADGGHAAALRIKEPWPDPAEILNVEIADVSFLSTSPFSPYDLGRGGEREPATTALARLYLPAARREARSLPAVVMLHGAGGLVPGRSDIYGPQLASMGVAALAIDTFGSRRERGTGFNERIINITETMMVADAYAGLAYLAGRSEIDPAHVALIGFSYGGMATTYALYRQIADRLARPDLRFVGHVAFYGPCIARFEDRRTTGAPLLMLYGSDDEIIDAGRCADVASDLIAGGSAVERISYLGAVHQWDGHLPRRLIGRNLADCDFAVETDGTVRDNLTHLPMSGPFSRKIELGLCTYSKPYPIGRDDHIRQLSNQDLGRFLERVFAEPQRAVAN